MEIVKILHFGKDKVVIEPPKGTCSKHVACIEQLADANGQITFHQLNRCPKCGGWYKV